MKTCVLFVTACIAFATAARAQDPGSVAPANESKLPTVDGVATTDVGSSSDRKEVATPKPGCQKTLTLGAYSNYQYQDIAAYGSTKVVTQDDLAIVCSDGKWVYDLWGSYGDTEGGIGADEIDITVHRNFDFAKTTVGPLHVELTGAYYFFNSDSIWDVHGHSVDLHADVSRPFKVGNLTITPFVRYTRIQFVQQAAYYSFVRPGVRALIPLAKRWSVAADYSPEWDWAHGSKPVHRSEIDLSYDTGFRQIVLTGDLRTTSNLAPMIGMSISKSW